MGEGQQRFSTEITDQRRYYPRKDVNIPILRGDGTNMQRKTWEGFKNGSFLGFTAAGIMHTKDEIPFTFTKMFESASRYGTPWVISGTVYGLTMSAIARLRQEDDYLNHICGGLASGSVMGSWFKNVRLGGWCAVIFAAVGCSMKISADSGNLQHFINYRPQPLNMYRTSWFVKRPNPEGIKDGDKDDSFQRYRP